MGTTGDRVVDGRLFYVERVYAGDIATSPIVIVFKEGEPVGDCSYPMSSGVHLVIAPDRDADGTLRADLVTLQADPNSDLGRRYVAEARARYGDGIVPNGQQAPARFDPVPVDLRAVGLGLALLAGGSAGWLGWRRVRRRGRAGI